MRKAPPDLYGIGINEIAARCRVSVKTAQRWKQGQSVPPETALMILRADLGCFGKGWSGWTIVHDELVSPEGWAIRRNDALAGVLLKQRLAASESEIRRLRKQLEPQIEDQPEPGDLPVIRCISV